VSSPNWPGYLEAFHTDRPGITEQVLCRARAADGDVYDWLAAAVPAEAAVLDICCGNAPLWTRLPGRAYLGVDINAAELAAARRRGMSHLVRAGASSLPMRDGGVDVVACSMALQVVDPLPGVLAEIGRVLCPGGLLVATVPARGPLHAADLPVVAGLITALGRGLAYPNDALLGRLTTLLRSAGLAVTADVRRRFVYPMQTSVDADLVLASLYLPGLTQRRYRAARSYMRTLARARVSLPLPIRRITAQRPAPPRIPSR
jgi:SAM-dependent methyltransferase